MSFHFLFHRPSLSMLFLQLLWWFPRTLLINFSVLLLILCTLTLTFEILRKKKHSICSLASGSVKKILVLLEIFLAWPFWSWLSSLALNSMVGLLQREIEYLEFQSDYSQLNPGQCPSLREWKSRSVLPSDFIDPLGVARRVIYSLQIFYPYSGRLKGNTVLLSVIPWLV